MQGIAHEQPCPLPRPHACRPALPQGFPDEFHLATLDQLLGALPALQPGVKVHAVMGSLMERLARWVSAGGQAGAQGTQSVISRHVGAHTAV